MATLIEILNRVFIDGFGQLLFTAIVALIAYHIGKNGIGSYFDFDGDQENEQEKNRTHMADGLQHR